MDEPSGGFAIGTYDERHIEDNAREKFGPEYGDKQDRAAQMKRDFIDAEGNVTPKGWDQLNKDIGVLEGNSMQWLRKTFESARDEGHDKFDDLIGTFWFNPGNVNQAETLMTGISERIDMIDTSFGDLGDSVWKGVSDFGETVLGGQIRFFDVDEGAKERAEIVADAAMRARNKRALARGRRKP